MRVLLLGASGFLGSHIRDVLSPDPGIELIAQSRRSEPRGDFEWVALDLATASPTEVAEMLAAVHPDAIVNAAGAAIGSDEALATANVGVIRSALAGVELLQTASPMQFVQLGSAAEYGPTPVGVLIAEETPPEPISAYGRSKLAATRLLLDAADRGELAVTVLRLFNPVGKGVSQQSLLGAAATGIHSALRQGSGEVALGPLDDDRDFIDARDVADSVHSALASRQDTPSAALINIGRGIAVQAREAVALLAEVAGYDGRIVGTRPGSVRSAGVPWQAADISRAHARLEWQPRRSLHEALLALWADAESEAQMPPR